MLKVQHESDCSQCLEQRYAASLVTQPLSWIKTCCWYLPILPPDRWNIGSQLIDVKSNLFSSQVVNVPSFIVRLDSQKHIDFSLKSPFGGELHNLLNKYYLSGIFLTVWPIFSYQVAGPAVSRGRMPRRAMMLDQKLTSKLFLSCKFRIKGSDSGQEKFHCPLFSLWYILDFQQNGM